MKSLALIAHDNKKDELVEWAKKHRAILEKYPLVATGTTGGRLAKEANLEIQRMLSGPLGGDLQIGALVCTGKIGAVFFLRDPLTAHPHEPDISALLKACDTYDVPLATNLATADALISGLNWADFD